MKTKLTQLTSLILLLAFLLPSKMDAHAPDQSYIYLKVFKTSIEGRVEMCAKDLNLALGTNFQEEIRIDSLNAKLPLVHAYLKDRMSFVNNGKPFNIKFTNTVILDLDEEESDDFAQFIFTLEGLTDIPDDLDITYSAMFDKDPNHRAMLFQEQNWKAGIVDKVVMSNIFEPSKTTQNLDLSDSSVWNGFWALVKLGMWHIWIGLDHILFIVALILPAVVRRRKDPITGKSAWFPVDSFKDSFLYIIKIITFFTIAHSITLALASLQIFDLPSALVETIIAASIALAALHNITPLFKAKEWIIAFGFGLFHGFGFASVLGEKGLSGDFMILSLLGFNIGVEIGQVLIICAVFPILFLIRKLKIYPYVILLGSLLLILISIYWVLERGFGIDISFGLL